MKNEIEELMMLTPKRKSILWRYKSDEDESIFVYGISKGRAIALSGEFAVNKEEVLKNKEKVKQLKDDSDINDGGISVLLENVSARIWELWIWHLACYLFMKESLNVCWKFRNM